MINLIQIQKIIENFFKNQSLVGSVKLGSVYDNLNTGNLKYPVLNIDHIDTVHNNFDTYNFYIYFADRLTENHNNSNYVVTSGINIMKMFTKYMEDNFSMQTPVTITPFVQKFADDCAGVWTRVSIEVRDDMDYCEDIIDIPTLYIVENGEYNTVEYDKVIVNVQTQTKDIFAIGAFENKEKVNDYLYKIKYEQINYNKAIEYFESHFEPINGACSAVIMGNQYGRNYDWNYNQEVEFIVRTDNTNDRLKTIGIAGSMAALTKDNLDVYSDSYIYLPFRMLDGINEYGVCANINVVNPDENRSISRNGTTPLIEQRDKICSMMLVRYIIDNFKSAEEAVNYIRDYVKVYPPVVGDEVMEFHFMVADKINSYVLEFEGTQTKIIEVGSEVPAVMTNFRLYGTNLVSGLYTRDNSNIEDLGSGIERANIAIQNTGSIETLMEQLKYTNAYAENSTWLTEFVGLRGTTIHSSDEELREIQESARELFLHRQRDGQTWQSVHTIIYDLDNLTAKLFVQEDYTNQNDITLFEDSFIASKNWVENQDFSKAKFSFDSATATLNITL